MDFQEFPKMARLKRTVIISEKIDGTNAQVYIVKPEVNVSNFSGYTAHVDGYLIWAGSRNRWITPEVDNAGFAAWVKAHEEELVKLGPGRHFGEWWGQGIQRKYGMSEKRWSLFNVQRWHLADEPAQRIETADPRIEKWQEPLPACCHLVPVLYKGLFSTEACSTAIERLRTLGSEAAPGFMKPEGIVCFHVAANAGFKQTLEKDEIPKALQ